MNQYIIIGIIIAVVAVIAGFNIYRYFKIKNGGTVSYSPLNYCKRVIEDDSQGEKLQNVVKALYLYYEAAKAYFAV